jgi:steroid delta-isomerase-like uncharacterized protein
MSDSSAIAERGRAARVEANRELGRRFFMEQDRLRGGPAAALCGARYTAHLGGNPAVDREGHEQFARAFYGAFPDMQHRIEQVIADEATAVVRFVIEGTHRAPFFGIPASGRRVAVGAHVILSVQNDRVHELFGIFDEAGLLRQIGALA